MSTVSAAEVPSGGSRVERRLEIDVVVNCCHGGPGEDGALQAALDLAGVAYTGRAAVDFATLMTDMIEEARRRPSAQWGSMGADGSALRSAA